MRRRRMRPLFWPLVATRWFSLRRAYRVGETALVFLGGEQSHAFTRVRYCPRRRGNLGWTPRGSTPQVVGACRTRRELWELGYDVLDAAASRLGIARGELLYARVDLIGNGTDAVLLLELG